MNASLVHGTISGPLVLIGFGSIGRGILPLLERHISFDKTRMTVIDPVDTHRNLLDERGIAFTKQAVTRENHRALLTPLLTAGEGQGFCINLSVDTSSLDIMRLCRELGVLYIDTVTEPWPGFYFDKSADAGARTNYALRETVLAEKRSNPGGITAVSCCGANPGMVSWFVKEALLTIARDTGVAVDAVPVDRAGWAALMQAVGVKGVHVAERDTQRVKAPKPRDTFWNTWSVEGFISEGLQPAELGWGSFETWKPENARGHATGNKAGIYLLQPGADTRVRTWCPTPGPQFGFLVTHNEAISISDYYTVGSGETPEFRPTCHYAYHPSDVAVLSLHEMFGRAGVAQATQRVLDEHEIVDGRDELGVLLYGHARNALWYGSRLTIEEARTLAPYQNATGLQVSSAVLAGIVWALENPEAGIVEADEMDHARCLEVQKPYLGSVEAIYTDWTPLTDRPGFFPEDLDLDEPWSFRNVLVR
ncbi:homospermidine synthase [Mongoliimonas terrestris]|uniref:homospermidine synthase n=1 Tax=Mongoliimonas terrestris TaxID=1709001 RepID=UPI0009497A7F|nr:saccharopine dehydrogenase NADP-binding domain-containing protein [Mongoliimonas terrestris]